MRRRAVEKMLAGPPAPPPPEGLAERIKAEVPERLELSEELTGPRATAPAHRATWTMAAAAAVLLGLTAAVTWQLRSSGPDPRLLEATGTPPAPGYAPDIEGPVNRAGGQQHQRPEGEGPAHTRQQTAPSPAPSRDASTRETVPADAASLTEQGRSQVAGDERGSEATEKKYQARPMEVIEEQIRELETMGEDEEADRLRSELGRLQRSTGGQRQPARNASPKASDVGHAPDESLVMGVPEAAHPTEAPAAGELYKKVTAAPRPPAPRDREVTGQTAAPSTGGTAEPDDQPYGDMFFQGYGVNPFIDTEDDHLSTFGLDVDTGSYTVVRRYLRAGHLPPPEAVRVEEVVNALYYGDEPPRRGDFALTAEGAPTPFADGGRSALLRFAVTARQVAAAHRPSAVLTVARDARARVDFDPDTVARYRLLGYENRDIADERFRDPSLDAGEVAAGHTVTALYEVELRPGVGRSSRAPLATLSLRWRPPDGGPEQETRRSLAVRDLAPSWEEASPALRLASLAAEFAEILKGSYWARERDLGEVLRRAQELAPSFAGDARVADFVALVATAAELRPPTPVSSPE